MGRDKKNFGAVPRTRANHQVSIFTYFSSLFSQLHFSTTYIFSLISILHFLSNFIYFSPFFSLFTMGQCFCSILCRISDECARKLLGKETPRISNKRQRRRRTIAAAQSENPSIKFIRRNVENLRGYRPEQLPHRIFLNACSWQRHAALHEGYEK